MILINKNSNNYLWLTLAEKTTLSNPTYLFKFTNDLTKECVRFICSANLSTNTQRYDEFLITETSGTNNYTSGVITLSPTGFWKYEVYEQSSTTNLNEALSTGLVESGKVNVQGTATISTTYDSQGKTFVAYGTGT